MSAALSYFTSTVTLWILPVEPIVAFLVGVGHVGGLVHAHIRPLVAREAQGHGVVDAAFRDLLPVHRERRGTALAEAAAIIGEIEPDRPLPGATGSAAATV